ncbi:MAG TPA: hypothetical protein VFB96_13295 [Pirellulaceae bacterium]|nr:hypothetical protein [Pirellulaceae bacterium]
MVGRTTVATGGEGAAVTAAGGAGDATGGGAAARGALGVDPDWPLPPKSTGLSRNWDLHAGHVTCCPICVTSAGSGWLHCGQ